MQKNSEKLRSNNKFDILYIIISLRLFEFDLYVA